VLSLGGSARRISVASAAFRLVVSVLTLSLGLVATTVRIADAAPSIVTSRFVPQAPTRLFDSRATGQRVQKGKTIAFTLDAKLAPGATAAVVNLTAVRAF
jgi:hypothetical protein